MRISDWSSDVCSSDLDLLLLTSHYEGYPAVLVEAIAAGVAVVTTDCTAALAEILSSSDLGTIAPRQYPATLAAAIMAQLDRPPPTREAVQRAAVHHGLDASATPSQNRRAPMREREGPDGYSSGG